MVRIRPYKMADAEHIIGWIKSEKDFAKWCANLIFYPLSYESLLETYKKFEAQEDRWLFTALNEAGTPIGFFMMTKTDYIKNSVHLGFVVVDNSKRNTGYGRKMINQAVKYAFEILCVNRVTLSVFDNNEPAHKCYLKSGFIDEAYKKDNFKYKNEIWGCYNMAIER